MWRRLSSFDCLDEWVVATDSEEVCEVCEGIGASVVLTRVDHPSGTDRVAEVAEMERFRAFELVVNVQGDEPLLTEEQIRPVVQMMRTGDWMIGTAGTRLSSVDEWRSESVVKVVRSRAGKALYFSRAPIPHWRGRVPTELELGSDVVLRHLGLYAYRRTALKAWSELPPSSLERAEMLEQLRPLQAGMEVGVAEVPAGSAGVDTPEDVERVERELDALVRSGN